MKRKGKDKKKVSRPCKGKKEKSKGKLEGDRIECIFLFVVKLVETSH